MITKILLKILEIVQIGFCSLLFSWIIYLRLFRWGSFYEVASNLLLTENYLSLFLRIYIVVCLTISLIIQFRDLYGIESKWKFTFLTPLVQFWEAAFEKFVVIIDRLVYNMGLRRELIIQFGLFLTNILNTRVKKNIFIYLIYFWPRFIYTIVFIVDLFIFNQFYYVFKFGWLLLIPFFSKYIEDVYKLLIEETIDTLETIFVIFDEDTAVHYTLRDYFWIGFDAEIAEKKHPIQQYVFHFLPSYLEQQLIYADNQKMFPDFPTAMEKHSKAYLETYLPLKHFFTHYMRNKTDLAQYSNILFTISYILIWTNLLIVTI